LTPWGSKTVLREGGHYVFYKECQPNYVYCRGVSDLSRRLFLKLWAKKKTARLIRVGRDAVNQ